MGTLGDVMLKVTMHVDKSFFIVCVKLECNYQLPPLISCSQVKGGHRPEVKKFFYIRNLYFCELRNKPLQAVWRIVEVSLLQVRLFNSHVHLHTVHKQT